MLEDSIPTSGTLRGLADAIGYSLDVRTLMAIAGVWLLSWVARALWNVSPFHPLSHIPGPKLAAATYLPEFYYDVILFGRYTRVIEAMHRKYGPIVRINPGEVHCNDIGFADEIYAIGARKRDKSAHQVSGSPQLHSGFATADHDLHRRRRAALARFFTRGQIAKLEPELRGLVRTLCDRILAKRGSGAVDLNKAYSCFTTEVITNYCFGTSHGFLDQPDFDKSFRDALYSLMNFVFVFRFFPFLETVSRIAPWFSGFMPDNMALLMRTKSVDLPHQIRDTRAALDAGVAQPRDTVFGSLLANPDLPEPEKSIPRLTGEAFAVIGAGTETTSWTLSVITYYLLAEPGGQPTLRRLTEELEAAGIGGVEGNKKDVGDDDDDDDDDVSWTDLEKLPFLGAVIQEGLRLSYGVSLRTARVARDEDLVYRGVWRSSGSRRDGERGKKEEEEEETLVEMVIPRGTAVGMSAAITHHDERLYPDSHRFAAERWLAADGKTRLRAPEQGLLTFSKGSRACIGMNLALCELHLVLAALVLRVFPHLRLHNTTEEAVKYDRDMFVPLPKSGSKGVLVMVE